MKKSEKKSTRRERRILVGSVLLAVFITAGATFAWFTSKDEVINKLSAQNSYGVSITETFTPENEWMPGQEVNKDVSVINTGNVDAFVKVSLSDQIKLTVVSNTGEEYTADNAADYVEIDSKAVIAAQAGGTCVLTPDDDTVSVDAPLTFESSKADFATVDGLYVFANNSLDVEGSATTTKYSGYYKAGDKFYALKDIALDSTTKEFSATLQKKVELSNPAIDFTVTSGKAVQTDADGNYFIEAVCKGQADGTADDVIILIYLNKEKIDSWTELGSDKDTAVFYYNKILGSAEQSDALVDYLVLSEKTTNAAYVAMDYELVVGMDSVQAVNKADKAEAVNSAWTSVTATVSDAGVAWAAK